jgi:hypothetical protein
MKKEAKRVDWSAKYNALPMSVRTITAAINTQARIQHLEMEKRRLLLNYKRSKAEIDDHIKGCMDGLSRMEFEYQNEDPGTKAVVPDGS